MNLTDRLMREKIEEIKNYAEQVLKQPRFEHSVRTAETCMALCRRFGLDDGKGYLAGIGHDICKQESDIVIVSLSMSDGFPVSEVERKKPALLHGRAAATVLKNYFGITDEEILEAVRNHTFGKTGMCSLAKVLFIADKIEPGREHVTEGYLKKFDGMSLNEMTCSILRENIEYVKSKGKLVSQSSLDFLNSLEKDGANKYEIKN